MNAPHHHDDPVVELACDFVREIVDRTGGHSAAVVLMPDDAPPAVGTFGNATGCKLMARALLESIVAQPRSETCSDCAAAHDEASLALGVLNAQRPVTCS